MRSLESKLSVLLVVGVTWSCSSSEGASLLVGTGASASGTHPLGGGGMEAVNGLPPQGAPATGAGIGVSTGTLPTAMGGASTPPAVPMAGGPAMPLGTAGMSNGAEGTPAGGMGNTPTAGAGSETMAAAAAGGATGTGIEPMPTEHELDCGPDAIVLEAHGPPENRINYIIVGDGYTQAELDTVYVEHLMARLEGDEDSPGRFDPALEPYRTYRNFVNICALKVPSNTSGVPAGIPNGNGQGCPNLSDTALDGCGDDGTRLGYISNSKVYAAVEQYLSPNVEMDWVAVVLNGDDWWNSGGIPMVWSGGHPDASLAAQHEGGHGFFLLGDEYGTCGGRRVNVNPPDWQHWLGTVQDVHADVDGEQGTGLQDVYTCDGGSGSKPTEDSVMNSLWRSSYLNSISLENAVRSIYEIIRPIDSATDTSTTAPGVLEVVVIDPAVIRVDWSVDGESAGSGAAFDVAALGLAPGAHAVTARAWDPTPWVPTDTPHGRDELEETVEWTITVP